jgi:hypothetical protein
MSDARELSRKQLVGFLGDMLLIRRFEERLMRFRAGDAEILRGGRLP